MEKIINQINGVIWSPALIYLCLLAGLFFSIATRFAQVRHFFEMFRLLIKPNTSAEGISSFQALAVSLSGRVGIGNIAGVAAAIGFGGPGAIFWMWVVAFLGASTAYIESTLAQIYKVTDTETGEYRGGPAYYFEKCLGWKPYGILFAIASIISCGLFLPGVQANGVANAITEVFGTGEMIQTSIAGEVGVNTLISLAFILITLGFIIFGGIKRIAHFTQIIVPFMALGYIILALIIVFININKVPEIFKLILDSAFSFDAAMGAAIALGVKRGVYSNEAGQGTGPHAAGAAEVEHPSQQGLVQAFSVYIDTLFVCSATAFMILITQTYNIVDAQGNFIVQNVATNTIIDSPAFTQMALATVFNHFGVVFVAIAVFFFAFTTILAYYYIAETNIAYLSEKIGMGDLGIFLIKVIIMLSVAYGAINQSGYVWNIGDIGVGLMAWLNIVGIIALYFLAKPTITALRDYETQKAAGIKTYSFNPKALGIKNATFWEQRWQQQNSHQSINDD